MFREIKMIQYVNFSVRLMFCVLLSIVLMVSCTTTTRAAKESSACKNLSKVINIDNLLYQMFSNIDSTCLFDMPVEELEEVWGVKILDYVGKSGDEVSKINEVWQKIVDRSDIEIFIARKSNNYNGNSKYFTVYATFYYFEHNGFGGSIGQGRLPDSLSKPFVKFPNPLVQSFDPPLTPELAPYLESLPKTTEYKPRSYYFWMNKNHSKDQPMLLMITNPVAQVGSILFYQRAEASSVFK